MTEEAVVRGAVFLLGEGSEKTRPVVVVQSDHANKFAPQAIVAAIRQDGRKGLPVHVPLPGQAAGLPPNSVIDCGFLVTISKEKLTRRLGRLTAEQLRRLDDALRQSLGLQ